MRRFVRDAGPLLSELIELTRCDCTTRNERKAASSGRRMDELERRIAELRDQEELRAIRPDLDGKEVMDHLGIAPCPLVGEAIDFLLELRLDEGPLGSRTRRGRAPRRLVGRARRLSRRIEPNAASCPACVPGGSMSTGADHRPGPPPASTGSRPSCPDDGRGSGSRMEIDPVAARPG